MADVSALADELGAAPPGEFARLDAAELDRFVAAIAQAKAQRERDIMASIDESLTLLPAMLRAPVRKVLGL